MALDATPGGTAANAYLTVTEADAYFAARGWATGWTSIADSAVKEGYLEWATRLLDQLLWVGGRATAFQALRWPRAGVWDLDGYIVGNTVVPAFIKSACCEWALALTAEDRTLDPGTVPVKRVKAGPVEAEFELSAGRAAAVPGAVMDIVRPYLRSAPGQLKLVRA